jgi:ribosomal protein L35
MFKLKNKSAIKKRIKLIAGKKKIKFSRAGRRHGMMQSNRSKLHLKKRMAVASMSDHQWCHIIKSMV